MRHPIPSQSLFRAFLIIILLLIHTFCIATEPKTNLAEPVWKEAQQKKLYEHPYWLKLLHYKEPFESLFQWSLESDIRVPHFFLADKGYENPASEMQQTLNAFFAPQGENPDAHAQCRFIARFHWLKEQLNFEGTGLKTFDCPAFKRWAHLEHVDSISVIFVSAYMSNPASIYGHNLLKINTKGHIFSHSLLSPTVNFGALVNPDDSPATYVIKGLFGGYPGRFSDERFYNYNHLYGESELRDLWEYKLNFDLSQQKRIIRHLWELLHFIDFKYYFFLDNCAYRISELLEMAWDDRRINPKMAFWAMPVAGFFQLSDMENRGEPLIKEIRLIPSRQRRLRNKVEWLPEEGLQWVLTLIKNLQQVDSTAFKELEPQLQSEILDVLIDYYQYQRAETESPLFEQERQYVLLKRSELPVIKEHPLKTMPIAPTAGTPPTRFRLAWVHQHQYQKSLLELGIWTSYHDLLGPEKGHLPNSELLTTDLRVRFDEGHIKLHYLDIVHLRSIKTSATQLPLGTNWSWQANVGIEPKHLNCRDCLVLNAAGGVGPTLASHPHDPSIYYAFLETFAQSDGVNLFAGLRPSLGLLGRVGSSWRHELMWRYWSGFNRHFDNRHEWIWSHRYTISNHADLRLELQYHEVLETRVAWNAYW